MAYDKNKIYEKAIKLIKEKKLYFIEDIVALLPCSKQTFYDYFNVGSDEMDAIKELLELNKTETKSQLRKKWELSDNPTLQVALMKIICTDEEAHRLNGSKTESKTEISGLPTVINVSIIENGS